MAMARAKSPLAARRAALDTAAAVAPAAPAVTPMPAMTNAPMTSPAIGQRRAETVLTRVAIAGAGGHGGGAMGGGCGSMDA